MNQMSADLDEDVAVPTILVKNVSTRVYADVYNSRVYIFQPGETKAIEQQYGPPVNEFGLPDVSRISNARDAKGQPLAGEQRMEVVKGGTFKEIMNFLRSKKGCPLVWLKKDGKDKERVEFTANTFRQERIRECRYIIAQHRLRTKLNREAGLDLGEKPPEVWSAEEDLQSLSRFATTKRFQITLDAAMVDTMDQAKEYIVHPLRFPEYEANDQWKNYVRDMRPGAIDDDPDKPLAPSRTIEAPLTSASAVASLEAPPAALVDPDAGPSPIVRQMMKMAEKAGRELSPVLIDRLNDPSDETAVEDTMSYIMAETSDGEGGDESTDTDEHTTEGNEEAPLELPTQRPGESDAQFRLRLKRFKTKHGITQS